MVLNSRGEPWANNPKRLLVHEWSKRCAGSPAQCAEAIRETALARGFTGRMNPLPGRTFSGWATGSSEPASWAAKAAALLLAEHGFADNADTGEELKRAFARYWRQASGVTNADTARTTLGASFADFSDALQQEFDHV